MAVVTRQLLDLVEARVRWLEGKLSEFADVHQQVTREGNELYERIGSPDTVAGRTVYLPLWLTYYRVEAERLTSPAAAMRSAAKQLDALRDQIRAVTRGSAEDVLRLGNLTARANTALRQAALLARVYQESPIGRYDGQVTSFWEQTVREIASAIPPWGGPVNLEPQAKLIYDRGVAAWEAYEGEIARNIQRGGNWWSRLTLRDKLALVGLGAITVTALSFMASARRVIPI